MTDLKIQRLEIMCANARKETQIQLESWWPWKKIQPHMKEVLLNETLYMLEEIKNLQKDLEEKERQLLNAEASVQHYKNNWEANMPKMRRETSRRTI